MPPHSHPAQPRSHPRAPALPSTDMAARPPAAARLKPTRRTATTSARQAAYPSQQWAKLPLKNMAAARQRGSGAAGGAAIERRAGAGQSAPQRLAVAAGGVAILDGGGERGGGGQVGRRLWPGVTAACRGWPGRGRVGGLAAVRALLRETVREAWLCVPAGDAVPTGDTAVGGGGLDAAFVVDPSSRLRVPREGPAPSRFSSGPWQTPLRRVPAGERVAVRAVTAPPLPLCTALVPLHGRAGLLSLLVPLTSHIPERGRCGSPGGSGCPGDTATRRCQVSRELSRDLISPK